MKKGRQVDASFFLRVVPGLVAPAPVGRGSVVLECGCPVISWQQRKLLVNRDEMARAAVGGESERQGDTCDLCKKGVGRRLRRMTVTDYHR